ncbi:MAG: calcium-binding protein [Rhodobacteraceae bacterium]|nr:calcium-binding protein [Paracoccaceae bacterium]
MTIYNGPPTNLFAVFGEETPDINNIVDAKAEYGLGAYSAGFGLSDYTQVTPGQYPTYKLGNGFDVVQVQNMSQTTTVLGRDGWDTLYGGDNVILKGGLGNDELRSWGANAELFGGQGDDDIRFIATGSGTIRGGTGNDWISAEGSGTPTIHGGQGDDSIFIDTGDATVFGGAGREHIITGSGNDLVYSGVGGIGTTVIVTKGGNDTIFGGADQEVISAGDGDDLVRGGGGNDIIAGDQDDSGLTTNQGNDQLYGGAGNDNLEGGALNDRLYGNTDNDTLSGGSGADLLFGGSGADTLHGGADDDRLTGGAGADIFEFGEHLSYVSLQPPHTLLDSGLDRITDFQQGTDLIALDLDGTPATWRGDGGFTADGTLYQLGYTNKASGKTFVELDADGDGSADLQIILLNFTDDLTLSDFLFS